MIITLIDRGEGANLFVILFAKIGCVCVCGGGGGALTEKLWPNYHIQSSLI